MRICVPTQDDHGLNARTHGHVGSAPFFTVADTEGDALEVFPNPERGHRPGSCRPAMHIRAYEVDAVICAAIGRRALASLSKAGIEVLLSNEGTVRGVIEAARRGNLSPVATDDACEGRGHGHGRGRAHA